ncbi:MAG TPA: hypothetical protein VMW72_00930 [Sedimentisphaerales bacterium]|nr:hypothetical protein [Sedimentisphaerales bacterium]
MARNTSTQSRIYDHAVGAVITLIIFVTVPYGYRLIKEFQRGKLRVNYPLLVYKYEYIEEYQGQKTFFGLVESSPQWVYQLSFANLSRKTIDSIDISLDFGLECHAVYIRPIGCQLLAEPKKLLPSTSFSLVGTKTDHVNLLGKRLNSGRSSVCLLVISSKERPSISSIGISLHCPAGKFEKITSVQWLEIGWQKLKD